MTPTLGQTDAYPAESDHTKATSSPPNMRSEVEMIKHLQELQ